MNDVEPISPPGYFTPFSTIFRLVSARIDLAFGSEPDLTSKHDFAELGK